MNFPLPIYLAKLIINAAGTCRSVKRIILQTLWRISTIVWGISIRKFATFKDNSWVESTSTCTVTWIIWLGYVKVAFLRPVICNWSITVSD